MKTPIERIFAQWAIGSGGDVMHRQIQWLVPETGWNGFANTYVEPVMHTGLKRIWLHSPFGRGEVRQLTFSDGVTGPSNYRFDEYLCSKFAGLTWDTDGFVETMLWYTKQNIEVCCYLGTLDGSWEFENKGKYAQKAFFERVTDSLAPILDSGCSVSIDSSCRATATSYVYALLLLLKARGVKTYIESAPLRDHPHFQGWDICCSNDHWPNVTKANGYFELPELSGEIVRLFGGKPAQYPTEREWIMDMVPSILNSDPKFSATIGVTRFLQVGGSVAELVSKIK